MLNLVLKSEPFAGMYPELGSTKTFSKRIILIPQNSRVFKPNHNAHLQLTSTISGQFLYSKDIRRGRRTHLTYS